MTLRMCPEKRAGLREFGETSDSIELSWDLRRKVEEDHVGLWKTFFCDIVHCRNKSDFSEGDFVLTFG
jgi:hypothetical protein